jgi:hypothetical protein
MQQKLEYIHQNPVSAGIVKESGHYIYSSARNYVGQKGLLGMKMVKESRVEFISPREKTLVIIKTIKSPKGGRLNGAGACNLHELRIFFSPC